MLKTQTGFIQGCYIGESLLLIYDLMDYTIKEKIKGLLMLNHFEKAFGSISWKFWYNVLQFFGFGPDFIHCVI